MGNGSSRAFRILPLIMCFYHSQLPITYSTHFCFWKSFPAKACSNLKHTLPKSGLRKPAQPSPAQRRGTPHHLSPTRSCRSACRLGRLAWLGLFSLVEVTKRPIRGAHHLTDRGRRPRVAHVDDIVEGQEPRLGTVCPCQVPISAIIEVAVPGCGIERLPQGPKPVHLSMVDPEGWVGWRSEQITAGITT